jgi:hypothetical protein
MQCQISFRVAGLVYCHTKYRVEQTRGTHTTHTHIHTHTHTHPHTQGQTERERERQSAGAGGGERGDCLVDQMI